MESGPTTAVPLVDMMDQVTTSWSLILFLIIIRTQQIKTVIMILKISFTIRVGKNVSDNLKSTILTGNMKYRITFDID